MTASLSIRVIRSSLVDWRSMKKECRHARHIYFKVEFITCFGGDSDPEGLNGSARKKKKKKKKRGKKVYREPIGRKLRQSCVQNHKHFFRIS
jgi:hypothetical protein